MRYFAVFGVMATYWSVQLLVAYAAFVKAEQEEVEYDDC